MNKMYKKIFSVLLILTIVIFIDTTLGIDIHASSINLDDINCAALYSATNTYDYNENLNPSLIPGEENNRLYIMNSSSDKNENVVSSDSPLLTVLTHGLGGSAYQWSNNGENKLGYTQDSILASLFDAGPSNVYVAEIRNDEYKLYDITEQIIIVKKFYKENFLI